MSTLNVWLIRHGESALNTGVFTDNPQASALTEKGKAQALSVAHEINEPPTLLVSSPANRAVDTAKPIAFRWPEVPYEVWPIQEWVYLQPSFYFHATPEARKAAVFDYWQQLDVELSHRNEAESFSHFIARVAAFHERLKQYHGFLVVVGHGMFFSAYRTCLKHGFEATPELMHVFREDERNAPIKNGEIIKYQLEMPG